MFFFESTSTNGFAVSETETNGSDVFTVSAIAPEGHSVEYSIVGGTGSTAFSIHNTSGVISVLDESQIDYSINQTFTLRVKAESTVDGGFDTFRH